MPGACYAYCSNHALASIRINDKTIRRHCCCYIGSPGLCRCSVPVCVASAEERPPRLPPFCHTLVPSGNLSGSRPSVWRRCALKEPGSGEVKHIDLLPKLRTPPGVSRAKKCAKRLAAVFISK